MNEKDYKKIATLIKEYEISLNQNNCTLNLFANDLADYFEEEENKGLPKGMVTSPDSLNHFNKKQFLKDCGVE